MRFLNPIIYTVTTLRFGLITFIVKTAVSCLNNSLYQLQNNRISTSELNYKVIKAVEQLAVYFSPPINSFRNM